MSVDTSRETVDGLALCLWDRDYEAESATLRALLAERDRYAEREAHFATALSVADGGRYRNDWDAAIRKVLAERDAARAEVARLREALAGLMVGCDHRTVNFDGITVTGWQTKRMPTDEALDKARAALAGGVHE